MACVADKHDTDVYAAFKGFVTDMYCYSHAINCVQCIR